MPEKLLKLSYIFWHSVPFYLFYWGSHFINIWGGGEGGILIQLFSIFTSNGWTSTGEEERLLGAQQGLAKLASGAVAGTSATFPCWHFSGGCPSRPVGFPRAGCQVFFPSWRAGKRIRGIPKGREEEDSGAFQPCGLSSKRNCSYKPWPQLQRGNPFFLRLSHPFLKKKKKGKKAARCLALSVACVPRIPS